MRQRLLAVARCLNYGVATAVVELASLLARPKGQIPCRGGRPTLPKSRIGRGLLIRDAARPRRRMATRR